MAAVCGIENRALSGILAGNREVPSTSPYLMRKIAKSWQADALADLRAAFKKGHRASLLQLPTGLGKTLVACRLFRSLKGPNRQLIIAVPSMRCREPWECELDPKPMSNSDQIMHEARVPILDPEADPRGVKSGTATVITHRQLVCALEGRGPRLPRSWIADGYRTLIVVDEYHNARRLKESLAKSFWSGDSSKLPLHMRRNAGGPPRYPLWLFLSATPYNPVRLDYDLDSRQHDSAPDEENFEAEAEIVRDEVRQTMGALAWIDRRAGTREKLDKHLDQLFEQLRNGERSVLPHVASLSIVPRRCAALRPLPPRNERISSQETDTGRCLDALWRIHTLLSTCRRVAHRFSTAERLITGGVVSTLRNRSSLYGHAYSRSTLHAMGALRSMSIHEGVKIKMMAVSALVDRLWVKNRKKIVIFCVHRAVASALARHLRSSLGLGPGVVTDASHEDGPDLERHCEQFNETSKLPGVLVTTDKLSESIDLHNACNVLIHYELPWSPLRVVQRFGRLWRIKTHNQKRPSRAPQVFHVVHPCGVEEEILNRLHRRWAYLRVLGLDYLPIEYGLGVRTPRVPWFP